MIFCSINNCTSLSMFWKMQQFVMTKRQPSLWWRTLWASHKKFYPSKYAVCCSATDVPSWKVTQIFSFRNRSDVSVYFKTPWKLFKNRDSRMTSPERFYTILLRNGLGHTREAESLNAYGLCFSAQQQCCLLYLCRAPENSKNTLLFKQEENPDHKPVFFYIVKNNHVSEPNTNTHMLGGSPPESTAFISS